MPYDGTVWDETQPTQSTLANTIDSITRDLKIGVRSRMANEHNWSSAQTGTSSAGQHLFISLQQQTAQPTFPLVGTTTQDGIIYSSSGQGLCYATYNTGAITIVQLVGTGQRINITGAVYSATGTIGDLLIGQTGTSQALKVLPVSNTGGFLAVSAGGTSDPAWTTPFGTVVSQSLNQIYQATNDGLVVAYADYAGGGQILTAVTDGNSTPSTVITISETTVMTNPANVTFGVKKGNYYEVRAYNTVHTGGITFYPFGI